MTFSGLPVCAACFAKSSQQSSESERMDMSRDFFEDDQRFARAYSSESEISPNPDVWGSQGQTGSQGAIQATPTIEVGSSGTDGITGTGREWPERKV